MAIYSGLFNSVNGDRRYDATWFARYFATFIGNGVFPNPSTGLQVLENENMTTTVKPGDGWINGYFIVNDSDHVLTHDNADGVLNRIDRVVMQLDYSGRIINILVKKGAFASTPVAPAIQRDADYYELVLADVYIKAGSTAITQANITDQRLNKALCGIVHGTVDQVDTTTIFNQYQSYFNQWSSEKKEDFENWVVTIKDILNGDVAGNLLSMIQENQSNINKLVRHGLNTTIEVENWVFDSDMGLYTYQLNDPNITDVSIVDVNVHLSDLFKAKDFSSATESFNGYVMIYANNQVNDDIIVDYRITKDVNI